MESQMYCGVSHGDGQKFYQHNELLTLNYWIQRAQEYGVLQPAPPFGIDKLRFACTQKDPTLSQKRVTTLTWIIS
jgi:hypothetical protein